MDVLTRSKMLLGLGDSTESDELLTLYSEIVLEELNSFIEGVETYPTNLVAQMTVYKFQRRGTEPLASADYSGSRETFINNYPFNIANQLKNLIAKHGSNRRLRTL